MRPMGVRPSSSAALHSKCRLHYSIRPAVDETAGPVRQWPDLVRQYSGTGAGCSEGRPRQGSRWQLDHRAGAQSCDRRETAEDKRKPADDVTRTGFALVARPGGSGPGSRMGLVRRASPKSDPRLGLDDREQISDMQIAVELRAFFIPLSSRLGPVRQMLHPVAVSFHESDRQQIPGGFLRWIVSL